MDTGSDYYQKTWSRKRPENYLPGLSRMPEKKNHRALNQLISQIKQYDTLRLKLEREGGKCSELNQLSKILTTSVKIQGYFQKHKVRLSNPAGLRQHIRDVDLNLRLDIRRFRNTKMPLYYLCRVFPYYNGVYSLIVEDLYMSPGYPVVDSRFIPLMNMGHEQPYLRLAQFRKDVSRIVAKRKRKRRQDVDTILHDLHHHIFQAAWHEDQRLGILIAEHFNIPLFSEAIYLLYLVLSGELCELRSSLNETMVRFFEEVYPLPAILNFLFLLDKLDGGKINELPQRAIGQYMKLIASFRRFLGVKVFWANEEVQIPLYKLLYANVFRLHLVAEKLVLNSELTEASAALQKTAETVIHELLAEK